MMQAHPEVAPAFTRWHRVAKGAKWKSLAECEAVFGSADQVGRFLIFNIMGGHYRLMVVVGWRGLEGTVDASGVREERMTQVGVLDEKKYGQLLNRLRPRVIKTDEDLERMAGYLEELDRKEETAGLTQEEEALQELLDHLCMEYNERCVPLPEDVSPVAMLKYLMEEGNLKQAELLDVFGNRATASQVLNGRRAISKAQARRLGERFRLPVDLFI